MKNEIKNDFWRIHLENVSNPQIHFVPSQLLDLEAVRLASHQAGFAFYGIDCELTHSLSGLLNQIRNAMNFPSHCGQNPDATLDMLTDLSWVAAPGYVLALFKADAFLSFAKSDFSVLLTMVQATISIWRDERGEQNERTEAVPFNIIFSASDSLKEALLKDLEEPLCEHMADNAIHLIRTPGGVAHTEVFRDAKRLFQSGADFELVVSFLHERGLGKPKSIYMIAGLKEITIPEAKILVENSRVWSDHQSETDTKTRNAAREALRDLGFDDI
ncbi:MAG: barstar family protein [Candidatus Acidiferrum sp.]